MRTRAAADFPPLLAQYVEHLRVRHYSATSIERAGLELPRLFEHLRKRGVQRARAVTEAHLVAYLANRRRARNRRNGEPLSVWTHSATVTTIRSFFAFLERRGVILRDPAVSISLPKTSSLPKDVLSEGQARRLMAAPFPGTLIGKRDRAILETLYGTGVRLSELVGCDLTDLDLAQCLLLVRNGKGRKDRVVPVPGRASLALRVYLVEARPELEKWSPPALFLSRFGQRVGRQAVQLLARRHGRAVHAHVSPHALRHTCSTHLLKGGASVRHVQQLLGHKRLATTAVYTRVGAADLRAVFTRSHPRQKPPVLKPSPITTDVLRDVFARAHPRRTADDPPEG